MKRLLVFATVVVLTVVASGLLLAQSNPFVGTWKLNPAKSKFTAGTPLKEGTLTVQMVGDQDQLTVNETTADGSPISAKQEVPDKGGAGKVLAGGPYDAISGKRIDDNTTENSYMKGGKEIAHTRAVVSKDGKTMRITNKGTDVLGKPVSRVTVWEKQQFRIIWNAPLAGPRGGSVVDEPRVRVNSVGMTAPGKVNLFKVPDSAGSSDSAAIESK